MSKSKPHEIQGESGPITWGMALPGVGGPIIPPEFLRFVVPSFKYQGRTVKKHRLTHQEAYLLAYLLNKSLYLAGDPTLKNTDGYYYHTQKDVEKYCSINTTSQKRCLRSLELLRVIHIDIRQNGYVKARYICVDLDRIRNLVDKHIVRRSD